MSDTNLSEEVIEDEEYVKNYNDDVEYSLENSSQVLMELLKSPIGWFSTEFGTNAIEEVIESGEPREMFGLPSEVFSVDDIMVPTSLEDFRDIVQGLSESDESKEPFGLNSIDATAEPTSRGLENYRDLVRVISLSEAITTGYALFFLMIHRKIVDCECGSTSSEAYQIKQEVLQLVARCNVKLKKFKRIKEKIDNYVAVLSECAPLFNTEVFQRFIEIQRRIQSELEKEKTKLNGYLQSNRENKMNVNSGSLPPQ